MLTSDVLVVGGGIAGSAAALAARSRGASTTLVRRGPGATALVAGGWLGIPPTALSELVAAAGLQLEPCTAALPHPDGRLIEFDVAPGSHASAAVANGAELALICGIAGLPSFRAAALARLWSHAAGLPEHALQPVTLTLADTPAAGWSPVSLAAALERDPQRLAAPLSRAVREHGAARVLLPAVLGLIEHARVLAEVGRATGVAVGEALGVAPCLPGWRLDMALMRALSGAGVAVVTGRVAGQEARNTARADATGRAVPSVTVVTGSSTERLAAGALVLATGKYIGGGIAADNRFAETAFGCDVVTGLSEQRFSDATEVLALSRAARCEPQAVLRLGIASTSEARPLTHAGEPAIDDVFLAGSVRAGAETATLGLGHAAREGWSAGLRAAAAAGRTG